MTKPTGAVSTLTGSVVLSDFHSDMCDVAAALEPRSRPPCPNQPVGGAPSYRLRRASLEQLWLARHARILIHKKHKFYLMNNNNKGNGVLGTIEMKF